MTKLECELALIKLGDAAMAVAKAFDANIDHLSMCCIGDYISVRGMVDHNEGEDGYTVINACRTDDGTMLCYSADYKTVKVVGA